MAAAEVGRFSSHADARLRKVTSGSTNRMREPLRKLCRRLASGHAPELFNAGGQLRSM